MTLLILWIKELWSQLDFVVAHVLPPIVADVKYLSIKAQPIQVPVDLLANI